MLPSTLEVKDERAEKAVLSTIWNEEKARKYTSRIFPQLFVLSKHSHLCWAMKNILEKGEPLDIISLTNKLTGKLTPLDVTEFTLSDEVLSEQSLCAVIAHLTELYFMRVTMNVSRKMVDFANARNAEKIIKVATALGDVHSALFGRSENVDHFANAAERVNSRSEYIPFSFPKLRALAGGYTRKEISSIGGKSGHNKTTFAVFDAIESLKQGNADKILYVAVDEAGEMVARRVLASQLKLSLSDMRDKKISLDPKAVSKAIHDIFKGRFIIIDNLFDADRIKQAILDIRPTRAIIDHIQELDYGDEGITDSKVMVASKKLKEAAKISGANVTILSQVRDKLIDERYDNKIPRPHDFLYASDLRRKSREQTVVYWEYKDSQKDFDLPFFDFIVWKSTYSGTGRVKFIIEPDFAKFTEKSAGGDIEQRPTSEGDIWKNI